MAQNLRKFWWILVFVMFGLSVFGGFVQDDRLIGVNPNFGKMESLFDAWVEPYFFGDKMAGAYRPITSLSYNLTGVFFGLVPFWYRLGNLIIYLVLVWQVIKLVERILGNKYWWVGLWWGVMAIHTEAVVNVVGRGEVLSMLGVIMMMRCLQEKRWEAGLVWWLLGLLAKESAMVWGVYLLWNLKGVEVKKVLVRLYYFGLVVGGYFLLRFNALGESMFSNNATMVENQLKFLGLGDRLISAISLITLGLQKVILPISLSYDYSFNQLGEVFGNRWYFYGGVLVIISLILLMVKFRKIRMGILMLALPLLLTSNLIMPIGTVFGERLWLFPSLGVAVIISWLIREKIIGKFILVALIFANIILGIIRVWSWRSEDSLFMADARVSSNSVVALTNMSATLLKQRKLDEAYEYLKKAEGIYPDYPILLNNMGLYYYWKGEIDLARGKWDRCVALVPGHKLCGSNLELLKK